MADTELSSTLYAKMSAEQEKYRDWLMDQPPADILLHAYEYAMREDILMEMEALELPDDQARALLASPDAMADIYKTFSKISDGHMDVIRESIEDRANTLIQNGILSPPKQEVVELFGTTALFFNERIRQENVPEGLYRYDLRGSDDDPGEPASLENHVTVNHAGTILTAKPLDIPEKGFLALDDGLNFTGKEMTVDVFRDKYASRELEVRDMILAESKKGHDRIGQDTTPAHKPSIRSQLATAQAKQAEKPAVQCHQKGKETR